MGFYWSRRRKKRLQRIAAYSTPAAAVNDVLPSVTGTMTVGETVTVSLGTWTGADSLAGSLRYVSDDTEIDTFTADGTYLLADTDFGEQLYLHVTAEPGSVTAESAATAAVDYSYIVRDDFTTDEAAPLASPRTTEPGGESVTLVQTNGQMSIVSSELLVPLPSPIGFPGVYYLYETLVERACGRALYAELTFNSHVGDGVGFGFNEDTSPGATPTSMYNLGVQFGASSFPIDNKRLSTLPDLVTNGNATEVIVIMRDNGMWLVKDDKLEWVGNVGTAGGYPLIQSARASMNVRKFAIADATGIWATQWGPATARVAAPTTGEVITGNADGTTEFTWTPASNETVDLMVRRSDADNGLIVRCDQAAGTIRIYEKSAGVETERTGGTTTQTWTAGTTYRIVIKHTGSSVRAWTATATTSAAAKNVITNSFNASATGASVSGFATGADFAAWPWAVPSPFPFDAPAWSGRQYATIGDSKTWVGEYQQRLGGLLNAESGDEWREIYPRAMAHNGFSAGEVAAVIAADIATISSTPELVLFNLGANDVADPLPAEATWKASVRTIWRAVHTAWAGAPIFAMRPWRRDYATECDSIAVWLADLEAEPEFSPYVHAGPDERVFLEGGDDGVTNTSDGIHPNAAGNTLTAQEWLTAVSAYL